MRNNFWLFIIVFLLFLGTAQAQTYTYPPFPSANFTWEGKVTCNYGSQVGAIDHPWTFSLVGDNTVYCHTYHKLRKSSSISVNYIREDSTKKVYLHDGNSEMLLFDFG